MHETKIGKFQFLVIKVYQDEMKGNTYLFWDQEHEMHKWNNQELNKGPDWYGSVCVFKDLNSLLNRLIKTKGTRFGSELAEIYFNNYPESDQMTKVRNVLYPKPITTQN